MAQISAQDLRGALKAYAAGNVPKPKAVDPLDQMKKMLEIQQLQQKIETGPDGDELDFSDIQLFPGSTVGTTESQVKGLSPVTKKQQESFDALENAKNILAQIRGASQSVNQGQFQVFSQLDDLVGGFLGIDQPARQLQESAGLLGNLARSLGGEKGVLTDKDIERISNIIPSVVDNKSTAERKLRFLSAITSLGDLNRERVIQGQKKLSLEDFGIGSGAKIVDQDVIDQIQQQTQELQASREARFAPGGGRVRSFNSVEAAEAAGLPPGTQVTINGRRAVIE